MLDSVLCTDFLLTARSDLDSKVLSIAETLNTVSLCFWQGIEIA